MILGSTNSRWMEIEALFHGSTRRELGEPFFGMLGTLGSRLGLAALAAEP